jgi:hypothetical protein
MISGAETVLKLFLITLLFTVVLFIGAALVFNFSKRRTGRTGNSPGTGCQHSGTGGCACTSAIQTTIQKLK